MTAEALVIAKLSASVDVTALVGSRIFSAGHWPHTSPTPAITYQRISGPRIQSLRGPTGLASPRIQIDCWADTEPVATELASRVRVALDGYADAVQLVNDQDLPETEIQRHRVSHDYRIWINE